MSTSTPDPPKVIKLVVIGDAGVGKTCMLMTYANKAFPADYIPTVFDNYVISDKLDGHSFELGLWDYAGREESDRMRPLSYANASVILICFSITDRNSFKNVASTLVPEVNHFCPEVPFMIVGLKEDLRDDPATFKYMSGKGTRKSQKEVQEMSGYNLAASVRP